MSGEQGRNIYGLKEGSVEDKGDQKGSQILLRSNTRYSIMGEKIQELGLKSISDFSRRRLRKAVMGSCLMPELPTGAWRG